MKFLKKEKIYEDKSYMVVETDAPKQSFYETNKNKIIIAGIVLIVLMIIIIIISSLGPNKCAPLEDLAKEKAYLYLEDTNTLPIVPGTSVIVEIDTLIDEGYIKSSEFMCDDLTCSGEVKVTKIEDDYIRTFNLTNCGECTTEDKYKMSGETSKLPNRDLVDVTTYYNYYDKETYNTSYTNYFESSEVSKTLSEYDNYLPLDEDDLPNVPEQAVIANIEQDTKNYYSYSDQQWKFYKDNGGQYSHLSSEQPAGYANKDTNTAIKLEYTEWSINYPEEKDYRSIKSDTGYQWYYENKDGDKVYYNNGEYLVDQPDDQYTEKSKESVKMYSYQDTQWRWYNGTRRNYSSYTSTTPSNYPNKDVELTRHTDYTSFRDYSSLDASNSSYRTEVVDVYSRYRIQYYILSFPILEEPILGTELEAKLGMTLEEIYNSQNYYLEPTYKYTYGK